MQSDKEAMVVDKKDTVVVVAGRSPRCYLHYFLEDARKVLKADDLGREIALIAFPALIALTADPLASLVDTVFIGRLGPVDLAAVGVSIAVFNLISKLLNFPVLNLTTSLVAEEDAIEPDPENAQVEVEMGISPDEKDAFISQKAGKEKNISTTSDAQLKGGGGQRNLPAVSTALIVGSALGVLELAILILGSGIILDAMGVHKGSNMRVPAEKYLKLRATGCPAVVVSLASQGVFRGFKDTRTPLFATATGNVVNMVLVPIFMFKLGLGVSGSAIATVISQYLIALILLLKLNKLVVLFSSKLGELRFCHFLKNGGLLLARSAAAMLSLTLATSEAARLGAIPMAAHQICMQVWLATSLLSDAIALAGQAIIASAIAKGNYDLAKKAAFRTLQMGFTFGAVLAVILGVGLGTFSKLFTHDPAVHRFIALGIPFVAATQPINAVAFVFDGLHFGASDYIYAAYSMIIVAIISSGVLVGTTIAWKFIGVWVGLSVLMTLRMLTGFLRVGTASGPWAFLK